MASQAGDALVDQHQVAHALGGVLQQAHGSDVVLRDVIPAGTLVRLLQVDGGSIHQQSHHACKVLDEIAVKDLLHKALEGGELVVAQQPVEVLVQDQLLRGARGWVIVCHLLGMCHQPLHSQVSTSTGACSAGIECRQMLNTKNKPQGLSDSGVASGVCACALPFNDWVAACIQLMESYSIQLLR